MAGADTLHECCEALELACLGGAGAELIGNAVDELDLELVRFTQSLHRHLERHRQATAESP